MKQAFVTGATGFLGSSLLRELLAENWQVTAIHRGALNQNSKDDTQVTWRKASLNSVSELKAALPKEPFTVFHIASDTSQWHKYHARQNQTNVAGTQNLLESLQGAPLQRFVYTSSISAFGAVSGVIDENTPSLALQGNHNYSRSKYCAQQMVLEAAVDAVVLNPCHIIGPGDTKSWIQIFQAVLHDDLPGIPPGGGNFAYVTEVARAHVAAAQLGRSGEKYLLGGPHASFLALIQEIQRQTGKKVSSKASPKKLLYVAERFMRIQSAFTGKEPQLTPDKLYALTHPLQADDSKAQRELGYKHKKLPEIVLLTLQWLRL